MPRLKNRAPAYRLHRASGQAVVTLNGTDHYLGPHGSAVSKREYDRIVGEWLAAGRSLNSVADARAQVTITEICIDYRRKAGDYYRKNGIRTNEFDVAKLVIRAFRKRYGDTIAREFGPIAYKALRSKIMAEGLGKKPVKAKLCRTTINHYTGKIDVRELA